MSKVPCADDLLIHVCPPVKAHKEIVFAELRASEDWNTKQVTVKAYLGIAPDERTVIEYPINVWLFGHWNRTTTRKVMSLVKQRFLAECKAMGYAPSTWREPLKTSLFWER